MGAGPIRFLTEPGAIVEQAAVSRTLPATASNTSIVFGDAAILQLLRRRSQGHHPDLVIPSKLARPGSRLVAAPQGCIEMSAIADPTVAYPTVAEREQALHDPGPQPRRGAPGRASGLTQ